MQVSVVIPTYNRSDILKMCLEALQAQNIVKSEYEIIVVDDGSTDNTKGVVSSFQENSATPITYLKQQNQGQGVARNTGIKHAKGKIVVMIGDDIIVTPDFLKEHLNFHRKYIHESEAVLGLILWHPQINITPLMRFLTNGSAILGRFGGQQFAYEKLDGKTEADFNFFYTSNISLKRSLLEKYPFDSEFSKYGWEDIELGYRLTKEENLKLYYNKNALAYHYHEIDEESLRNRMQMIGESSRYIHKKYPELRKRPSGLKKFAFSCLSNSASLYFFKQIKNLSNDQLANFYYYALSKKYFLEGLNKKRLTIQ